MQLIVFGEAGQVIMDNATLIQKQNQEQELRQQLRKTGENAQVQAQNQYFAMVWDYISINVISKNSRVL